MKFVLNLRFGYYFLDLANTHLEHLKNRFPDVEFVTLERNDPRFPDALRGAEALATWPIPPDDFKRAVQQAEKLRWVQFSYVGVAPDYLNLAREKNIVVTNARGVASEAIAEHTLGFVLMFERQLHQALWLQRERRWDHRVFVSQPFGFEGLAGKVLGIVGLGGIGQTLARKAACLGLRVVATRKHPGSPPPGIERLFSTEALPRLLAESDFVVLALPLLPETRGLIGEKELQAMKKSAVLINVSRGELVDEQALLEALRDGWIAGAALDVTSREPLPEDSPLYEVPNLILTPHIAGLDRRYTDRLVGLIAENLERYRTGKPMKNLVNSEQGY